MGKYGKIVGTLTAVMLSLTLVTTSIVGGLMARYVSTSSGGDVARVAVMANDVEITLDDVVMISPGDESIVPVELTNYSGNTVCEVAQRYTMTVEYISDQFDPNLPLKYAVYTDADCTKPDGGKTIKVDDIEVPGAVGEFAAGVKEEPDQYWFKVTWPEDENNSYFAFEIDALKVKIRVEQID